MNNLRDTIELLFFRRRPLDVLNTLSAFNETGEEVLISREEYKNLYFSQWSAQYSGNQVNSIFDILNGQWSENRILKDTCTRHPSIKPARDVFNVLTQLTSQILETKGGIPHCKYQEYLRWTEASQLIGEDILVTNFLAADDSNQGYERADFAWPAYILTDSRELRGLMQDGLAELHNHLYGSSLIFTFSWLAIMNSPRSYGGYLFKKLKNYDGDCREIHLAAFIRSMLFKCVSDFNDNSMDEFLGKLLMQRGKLDYVSMHIDEVQHFIEILRASYNSDSVDYAIPIYLPAYTYKVNSRIPLIGERRLLYLCFQRVNGGTCKTFKTLLYTYLLIKARFRYAMVQVNDIIGFENFQYYDNKKESFLKDFKYREELLNTGLNLPIQGTYVTHIEYRVGPGSNVYGFHSWLANEVDKKASKEIPHGYIVHFIKEKDNISLREDKIENSLVCRNQTKRKMLYKQAYILQQLIERGETLIIGIDAAGSEFYCRPEVFSIVFRKLRSVRYNPELSFLKCLTPMSLGVTYHVGEDFYDILDGLRAIDEAIKFLNLGNEDRIGHGTALGLDALNYYKEKHFTVVMPKQVLLDNLAWLIDKMEQYNLPDQTGFKYVVETLFYCYCKDIFETEINVKTYIHSWLLRGDDPELYLNPYVAPVLNTLLDSSQLNKSSLVEQARKDASARNLYYRYHYDYKAKYRGSLSVEWKIDAMHRATFVDILKKIQEIMQLEVAEKHIAIECNPTSNLRISNLQRYIDHPIIKFNNKGLVRTDGKQDSSSHISVSINTDDAGIFATSLEKEYTLMALALEKERDENGNPKYQRSSVYRWLENIRQAAFTRKFGADN